MTTISTRRVWAVKTASGNWATNGESVKTHDTEGKAREWLKRSSYSIKTCKVVPIIEVLREEKEW